MKYLIYIVILMLSLNATTFTLDKCCDELIREFQKSTVYTKATPPVEHINRVFRCIELEPYIKHLDTLDRDFIYLKAKNYTRKRFNNSLTHTTPRVKFSDFLPKDKVDNLFFIMNQLYPMKKRY